ncbi:branched-chain amino acid ABC transporter permease (plasmid) [Agrobacterium leguminum]|uniref:branched-chain amino acid ABC transporter permease n=1 Tax=Agrobacterium leguminum TaxID=2792015 RepID=UPI00272BD276|nr:branched-chain amino acid ABC transporter permease [Agrobacterium leguminum]WLE00712.1 branched-chain amino acid ABC transporter permease [Agrobacterium leguminum]
MNSNIAVLLAQDALINGAIYALLALTLVMVFSVTRVMLIPQGEVVSLTALSLAAIETGVVPGTVWLLCIGGGLAAVMELYSWLRERDPRSLRAAFFYVVYPLAITALAFGTIQFASSAWYRMVLTLLIVVPLGLMIYRVAFRPLAHASVLVLLIVAMAIHFILLGFGLVAFGAEGVRTAPIFSGVIRLAGFPIKAQAIFVVTVAIALIVVMALFFGRTLLGKALRATAFNRTGARLVGIRTESSGTLAFFLAGLIGAISGLLIAPMTTIYFDTGFLIGLKGFIAAIVGGLASYPLAAGSALLIGLVESYSSFWASAFKDVIVFALIIPVLLWRNYGATHAEEEDE